MFEEKFNVGADSSRKRLWIFKPLSLPILSDFHIHLFFPPWLDGSRSLSWIWRLMLFVLVTVWIQIYIQNIYWLRLLTVVNLSLWIEGFTGGCRLGWRNVFDVCCFHELDVQGVGIILKWEFITISNIICILNSKIINDFNLAPFLNIFMIWPTTKRSIHNTLFLFLLLHRLHLHFFTHLFIESLSLNLKNFHLHLKSLIILLNQIILELFKLLHQILFQIQMLTVKLIIIFAFGMKILLLKFSYLL